METFFLMEQSASPCKKYLHFLACGWFFGLVAGVFFSLSAGSTLFPWMRAAVYGRVSIVSLLSAVFLPFLITALAVFLSRPLLLVPLAFCKAFLFTFLGAGVLVAFGPAGWLVRLLLMFSQIAALPLLWWCWLRCLSGVRGFSLWFGVCFWGAVIAALDYCVISPFLANLLS